MATTLQASGAVRIVEGLLPDGERLFQKLLTSVPWDGRMRARKAASFGLPYNYSGVCWPAAPFPELVLSILERVSTHLGYRPNNCLAHLYPDGDSAMGFHSDATDDLEVGSCIAVVSLGAERVITFRNQQDRTRLEHYPLPRGSLLQMTTAMQQDWKHAILPTDGVVRSRISLTFRQMIVLPSALSAETRSG